jgi:xanthine dehydrogenase D subunit
MSTELAEQVRATGGIGDRVVRIDALGKVTGKFAYASDLSRDGMLWGATARSSLPFARIVNIDVRAALACPGVRAVMVAADVPGKNRFGLNFDDQPVLADSVIRFAGEPIAVVAAESRELAIEAARRVSADLEPLEPLLDMEKALEPDAPTLHEFGNVLRHVHLLHGDPDHAEAAIWVDGYYETAMQDPAPLGPEAGLAVPAADGGVDLYVATQWLHVDREQIAPCLGLPEEKVRVRLAGVGGAFGSREDIHVQVHAAMLALRTGRPVKMCYGREESFHGHMRRHPARIWLRHGATTDGHLVAVVARLMFDGGAYTSSSPAVIGNAVTFAPGPYEVPNVRVEGTLVYTNNPPCGAMRGFGAPQVCFAYEAQMDKLARRLDLDPLEIRRRNALRPGSMLPTGHALRGSAPVRELIDALAAMPLPEAEPTVGRPQLQYPGGTGGVTRGESLRRGVGYAIGYKNVGFSEGFDDSATARVTLRIGTQGPIVEVYTAAVEMGQGLYTLLTQVVRTELGIDDVRVDDADTLVGNAGSTSASRQSMMAGGAVQLACRQIRSALAARLAGQAVVPGKPGTTGKHPEIRIAGEWLTVDGLRVKELADLLDEPLVTTAVYHHRATESFDADGQGDVHVCYTFAAERAVVEVDTELGLARVVEIGAALDAGRVINPLGLEGQIEGGTAQGLGLALMEEVKLAGGVIQNASFTDYLVPTMLDVPPIVSAVITQPDPDNPYGLKGIGEAPTIVSTAAIVAALRDATGRELNRAPVTPDELAGLRGPVTSPGPPNPPQVPGQWPVPYYSGMTSGQQNLM